MASILIADDNVQITSILSEYASREGHQVFAAYSGTEALELFTKVQPDLVLLDVMMPGMDGFEVCREIRKTHMTPVIMVTARGEDFERIMGLDIGADDYILKPFSPNEVMARIRAVLRRVARPETVDGQHFSFSNLTILLDAYQVLIDGKEVPLTKKEVEILWTLASNRNKAFSRDNLLNSLWGYDYFGDTRTVDSHVKRLRSKMEAYPHKDWDIKTIWGVGYKFEISASGNSEVDAEGNTNEES